LLLGLSQRIDVERLRFLLLDYCKHGVRNSDHTGFGDEPPRLVLSAAICLAADLAQLAEPNHIIEAAVAFEVKNCSNPIVTHDYLDDRNLAVLTILTPIDFLLVLALQIAEINPAVY